MLQSQMRQDVMPGVLHASFPADDSVEAAEVPAPPTQDVLPKAVPVALSLMKPASPFTQATESLGVTPVVAPEPTTAASFASSGASRNSGGRYRHGPLRTEPPARPAIQAGGEFTGA